MRGPISWPVVYERPTMVQRYNVLGVDFDLVDYAAVWEVIRGWRLAGRRSYVCMVNPHSVLTARRDGGMDRSVRNAGLVLPDGVGVAVAARLLGYGRKGRVTGPMLMLCLCDWGRQTGCRHYFYGGATGIAERLAGCLRLRYPGMEVAGTYCPPFGEIGAAGDAEIVERINAARADIVWVGLGAPKQEKWMAEHAQRIDATAMIGVGAAFDFHCGNVKWAPQPIRALGLEWAWRLALEPGRMWRRNLDSPLFLMQVLAQGWRMRRSAALNASPVRT